MSVIVLIVVALFAWVEFVFIVKHFLQLLQNDLVGPGLLLFLGWHFLWGNMVVCYFRCVFTDPGSVPEKISRVTHGRLCSVCENAKPPRCHHCRQCGTCVLKMDHHCPWINNCVGFRNQKFFILFLLYTSLTSLYFLATSIPLFFSDTVAKLIEDPLNLQTMILSVICVSFGFGLLAFAGFHFSLVLQNQTTLESGPEPNPYDVGRKSNWRQVFGPQPMFWFFPVANSVGNGYDFPLNTNKGVPEEEALEIDDSIKIDFPLLQ